MLRLGNEHFVTRWLIIIMALIAALQLYANWSPAFVENEMNAIEQEGKLKLEQLKQRMLERKQNQAR
jgi:hypothetical protein